MNIEFHARQYRTEAEQLAAARERRAKLFGPQKLVNWKPPAPQPAAKVLKFVAPPAPPAPRPATKPVAWPAPPRWAYLVLHRPPLWTTEEITFRYHVELLQTRQAANGHPLKTYIRQRAEELGFSYVDMIGPCTTRKLALARALIMWEIKTNLRPEISLPEIGRLFGGRDHTTCRTAIMKIQAMKDRGELD